MYPGDASTSSALPKRFFAEKIAGGKDYSKVGRCRLKLVLCMSVLYFKSNDEKTLK
jgi:hypothetical protein